MNCEKTNCQNNGQSTYLPVMAYVPSQKLETVYEAEQAFRNGTLFPEIYKPFNKGGCKNG